MIISFLSLQNPSTRGQDQEIDEIYSFDKVEFFELIDHFINIESPVSIVLDHNHIVII